MDKIAKSHYVEGDEKWPKIRLLVESSSFPIVTNNPNIAVT